MTRIRNSHLSFALTGLAFLASSCVQAVDQNVQDPALPNILLIVVDDMGMADIGAFGSEIDTPNLDKVAASGVILTNFHTSSVCSATRAMLLTGTDNHLAGFGNLAEELAPNQVDMPGYEGRLNDRVVTLATLLKAAGYLTFVSGKWHLGASDDASPRARGFDRSFTMLAGGASHFADMKPAYHPDPTGIAPYREDGVMLDALPETFEYSTQFFTDQLIGYIENAEDDPYFAYLAYTAPHWPLQAPEATIQKYRGRYDDGYGALLEKRFLRQKELGVIPTEARLNTPPLKGRNWELLDPEDKRIQARAMEIYAAMIDEIDQNIGRLLSDLEARGDLDDTLIIFMSDNGAEGHDLDETWPSDQFPDIRANIDARHDFSYENMGKPNSYVLYGPDWARAGAPAYRLHKGFPTEGGTRVAAIASYPGAIRPGKIDTFVSVKDIVPTVLELVDLRHPAPDFQGRIIEPITGQSMLGVLTQNSDRDIGNDRLFAGEVLGKYFIRKGNWKMVFIPEPYGSGKWELFDLVNDLAETRDLSAERADLVRSLKVEWANYVERNGVILPDWVSGY